VEYGIGHDDTRVARIPLANGHEIPLDHALRARDFTRIAEHSAVAVRRIGDLVERIVL